MMACTFTLTGCKNIEDSFISDGDFQFYYDEDDDCYAVVDVTEQGSKKETLFIPPYFKNKFVGHICHEEPGIIGGNVYRMDKRHISAQTIFMPFTLKSYRTFPLLSGEKKLFFPGHESPRYSLEVGRSCNIYVSVLGYQKIEQLGLSETAYSSYRNHLYIANTAFMFNYDGEPNDGYFLINDFERGGKIENTPYEPKRDGYTFGGWYKESECVNAWNFAEDTLPEAEYDEEGNLIFVETRLYAKWFKN